MKKKVSDLKVLGGEPQFHRALPVGQLNFPDWEKFEAKFRGIFSRRYYTNHGPLAQELEEKLARFLQVKHVVCMTNATIGLMIAAKAMRLQGKVILPAFTFAATAQSLSWAGLDPVFCDVDPETHQLDAGQVEKILAKEKIGGILGVHVWGNPCSPKQLQALADRHGIPLYFDSAHAFGCTFEGKPVGGLGNLEVFSFHATKVLNASEGGCVCTNDDEMAAQLRNIRSSYGAGRPVEIPLTGNGRMSEAQAAMALLSLEDYPQNQARNRRLFMAYHQRLQEIPGIRLISPAESENSNFQYVVMEISREKFGISRDQLVKILQAENVLCRRYFAPGLHRSSFYGQKYPEFVDALPVTDRLSDEVMQVPSGQDMDEEKVHEVSALILFAHKNAHALRSLVSG